MSYVQAGFAIAIFSIAPLCLMHMKAAAAEWRPLVDLNPVAPAPCLPSTTDPSELPQGLSLEVKAGTALDFSHLGFWGAAGSHGRVIVGSHGKLAFETSPHTPRRFLGASFAVSPTLGSFPSHENACRIVTQLRRQGYNLVRFHFVDATLMNDMEEDFGFDAEQFERFHFFLARLKEQGIYWVFDGLTSDNGAYGGIFPHRYIEDPGTPGMKLGVYHDESRRQHYRDLIAHLFATVNPYTQTRPIDDPALAAVILVNEGGLSFLWSRQRSNTAPNKRVQVLEPLMIEWLREKYIDTNGLRTAWGTLNTGETLDGEGNIDFPGDMTISNARTVDFSKFFLHLETTVAAWMTDHWRQLGYQGLITSYNNWYTLQANLARSRFSLIDMHEYHDHPNFPSGEGQPGSSNKQTSSLVDSNPDASRTNAMYFQRLAINRYGGRPFTVSEYSHSFWNAWRRESGLVFPGYAAFQDWDMITQYNFPILLSYDLNSPYIFQRSIRTFNIGQDPIAKANERLAALLFLRRDVAPSPRTIGVQLDASLFPFANNWNFSTSQAGGVSYHVPTLSLVTGIGVKTDPTGLPFHPSSEPVPQWSPAYELEYLKTKTFDGYLGELKAAGIVPVDNPSNGAQQYFKSNTGELTLDGLSQSLVVNTPRTQGTVFAFNTPDDLSKLQMSNLKIVEADRPAMLAVSAIDEATLQNSQRMLAIFSTDALNSNMTFRVNGALKNAEQTTVEERKVLENLGSLPVLMQSGKVQFELKNTNSAAFTVYALSLDGTRRDEVVPVYQPAEGVVRVTVDTRVLSPTNYFEIVSEANSAADATFFRSKERYAGQLHYGISKCLLLEHIGAAIRSSVPAKRPSLQQRYDFVFNYMDYPSAVPGAACAEL